MDGSDLPAAAGDHPPETVGDGGAEGEQVAPRPERCEDLAAAIAGVLGDALREHEEQAAATARSQDELTAVIDRLNGVLLLPITPSFFPRFYPLLPRCYRCHLELDKLLENAPSLVIMQHAARISSIRKRISALNMLLKSIQRRIDNVDRIISTGVTSDHSSPVQFQSLK